MNITVYFGYICFTWSISVRTCQHAAMFTGSVHTPAVVDQHRVSYGTARKIVVNKHVWSILEEFIIYLESIYVISCISFTYSKPILP